MNSLSGNFNISILFGSTVAFTLVFLYKKLNTSKKFNIALIIWLFIQAFLGIGGFYFDETSIPPRFILLVLPPVIFIVYLFNSSTGKNYLNNLNIKHLILLHVIRIPVEIVLWALYVEKQVPELMTFKGVNFDIFSGISAMLIYIYLLKFPNYKASIILIWNFVCLMLLMVIVGVAILSAPSPFQQLAMEQPNIGVLKFPFNWLPSFIVPVVLFSHLAAIRNTLKRNSPKKYL